MLEPTWGFHHTFRLSNPPDIFLWENKILWLMSYRRAICEKEFDEIIHLGGKMRMWKSDFFFPITTMSLTCLKKIRCFFRTARSLTLAAQLVNHLPAMQETPVRFQGWEDPLEKGWATHSSILGLPWCSVSKEATCSAGDLGLIPELRRFPGGGHGNPLHYSCWRVPKDREASQAAVHGAAMSLTQLGD